MTGPQHWAEAQLLLAADACEYSCPHSGCQHELRLIARAQAHATLAVAAAVADAAYGRLPVPADQAWEEVLAP